MSPIESETTWRRRDLNKISTPVFLLKICIHQLDPEDNLTDVEKDA